MTSRSMEEAEGLAVRLLQQGQARSVDLIPSAHTLSLDAQGQAVKTSAVLVVAHQDDHASEGGLGVVTVADGGVRQEAAQPEVGDRLEKLWSSSMLKARANARNQWDEEVILSGGDPFFFGDGGEDEGKGEEEGGEEEEDGGGGRTWTSCSIPHS